MRYAILCAGCQEEILVRLSVFPCEGIRFYFSCPACEISITGHMRGDQEIQSLVVSFDGCEKIAVDWDKNYPWVATVAPNLPLKRNARELREVGGAPAAMLYHIAGDNVDSVVQRMSIFHEQRATFWPNAQRMYEYYLHEQWERFADIGTKLFGPDFVDPGHGHGRESIAYRAVMFSTLASAPQPYREMLDEIIRHMETMFDSPPFRDFAKRSVESGELQHEQRRIWDSLCLLMKTGDMWILPGILWSDANSNPKIVIDELSLSRDEFHQLRDIYITCFEACCKGLVYLMAFINTSSRGHPERFTRVAPLSLPSQGRRQQPPRTFTQFRRIPNAEKISYLHEWPVVGARLSEALSSRLRNSLGHNSVRHDLRTDFIVTDDGPVMSYFEFTATIYQLNAAVQIIMNILHSVRMAATQPLA